MKKFKGFPRERDLSDRGTLVKGTNVSPSPTLVLVPRRRIIFPAAREEEGYYPVRDEKY